MNNNNAIICKYVLEFSPFKIYNMSVIHTDVHTLVCSEHILVDFFFHMLISPPLLLSEMSINFASNLEVNNQHILYLTQFIPLTKLLITSSPHPLPHFPNHHTYIFIFFPYSWLLFISRSWCYTFAEVFANLNVLDVLIVAQQRMRNSWQGIGSASL